MNDQMTQGAIACIQEPEPQMGDFDAVEPPKPQPHGGAVIIPFAHAAAGPRAVEIQDQIVEPYVDPFQGRTARQEMAKALQDAAYSHIPPEIFAGQDFSRKNENMFETAFKYAEKNPQKTFLICVDNFTREDLAAIAEANQRNTSAKIVVFYDQGHIFDHATDPKRSYVHAFSKAAKNNIFEALYPDQVADTVRQVTNASGIRMVMGADNQDIGHYYAAKQAQTSMLRP